MQAQAAKEGEGRRPLIVGTDSRRMLQGIRKSLSHLNQTGQSQFDDQASLAFLENQDPQLFIEQFQQLHHASSLQTIDQHHQDTAHRVGDAMQIKADISAFSKPLELAQSVPNLNDKSIVLGNNGKVVPNGSNGNAAAAAASSSRGFKYNQKAMAEIKQSLQGFQINGAPGGVSSGLLPMNGYNVEVSRADPQMLRQLVQMGIDEAMADMALRATGNRTAEHARRFILQLSQQPNEKRNGFTKIREDLQGYGSKVTRKPSFEKKYRTDSPVNSVESGSMRSDSPSAFSDSAQYQLLPHQQLAHPTPHHPHLNFQTQLQQQQSIHQQQEHSFNSQPNRLPPSVDRPPSSPPPPLPPRGVVPMSSNGRASSAPLERAVPPAPSPLVPNSRVQQALMRKMTSQRERPTSQTGMVTPNINNARSIPSPVLDSNSVVMSQQQGQTMSYSQPPPYSQIQSRQLAQPPHRQMYTAEQGDGSVGHPDEHSPLSSHSSSPAPFAQPGMAPPRPVSMQACKYPAILMLKAESREVAKPLPEIATAPLSPPLQVRGQHQHHEQQQQHHHNQQQQQHHPQQQQKQHQIVNSHHHQSQQHHQFHQDQSNYVSKVQAQVNSQQHHQGIAAGRANQHQGPNVHIEFTKYPSNSNTHHLDAQPSRTNQLHHPHCRSSAPYSQNLQYSHNQQHRTIQIQIQNQPGMHVQHRQMEYSPAPSSTSGAYINTPSSTPRSESPIPRCFNQSPLSVISTTSTPSTNSDYPDKPPPPYPGRGGHNVVSVQSGSHLVNAMRTLQEEFHSDTYSATSDEMCKDLYEDTSSTSDKQDSEPRVCTSPKPERSAEAQRLDCERQESKIRHFSPQAYKFFMEQHVENLLKSYKERDERRNQLEQEMAKIELAEEARHEMRKMLSQKESNYIRLKRARLDKSMFNKIKTLGIGAFGEVALVCKRDNGQLFAMKTLHKRDVLRKNQVAHVKAERDILAEADNEWVVKLYYSFQDQEHLYFVMDYIPGGDMMSLLMKFGIFPPALARFYTAELVLAIESVHRMGFIHRDIKPDNILIDKDGHIKLTDFGLCTGFRWTHDSKYYQGGNHIRQDSMDPGEDGWGEKCACDKELLKPLERRNIRHQRCLAHSLVGTPNYIAPEVLLRQGYTACCDWWSVGVILYEMLVGQPPFLANTPAETQLKVIQFENMLQIPPEAKLSPEASDLILRLCCNKENRLGSNSAGEVKHHSYFKDVHFSGLRHTQAPHIPTIRYATDTSNFDPVDQDKLRQSSTDSQKRDSILENGRHPEHAFLEFTFRRFFDDGGQVFAQKMQDPESKSAVYV